MSLTFLIVFGIICGYLGGLVSIQLRRLVLLFTAFLLLGGVAQAYDGYWYQPQPRQQLYVQPQCFNPYQFHSPYTYRTLPRYQPRHHIHVQPKRSPYSFHFSW